MPISPVLWSTSFQCPWVRGSFYERSRIGESTERSSGSWLKRSATSARLVVEDSTEEPNGVLTASLQWMWIEPGLGPSDLSPRRVLAILSARCHSGSCAGHKARPPHTHWWGVRAIGLALGRKRFEPALRSD